MRVTAGYNAVEQTAFIHRHHAKKPQSGSWYGTTGGSKRGILHLANHGDVVVAKHVEPVVMGQSSIGAAEFSRRRKAMALVVLPHRCTKGVVRELR